MAWMKPIVKSGWLATDALIPLVLGNGITDGSGEEPTPPINWKTVTGSSPLALVNALAHEIKSLTQYGKCVQDGTPTPDAPVDIMCNNGAIKYGTLGSNLYDPSTAVFEVGYYYNPNADGAQTAAQNNFIYYAYIPIEAGEAYVFYGRQKETNRISQYNRIHWYDESKTYIGTNTYTAGAIGKGVAPDNAVYAKLSCNPQGANTGITEETVLNYNWTFCKGTAEVTPFVPFVGGIYPDGTPETLTVSGKNLFDPATSNIVIGEYVSVNGSSAVGANNWRTDYIPIVGGKTYAFWGRKKEGNTISAYNRMNFYTADKTHITPRPSITKDTPTVGTAPSNAAFVRLSSAPYNSSAAITRDTFDEYNWMFAEAAQEIPYEPYVQPQTVTVPMLLGVGDYKDEAELIQGIKTGKVGIYVFTGEEDFTKGSAFYTTDTSFLPSKAGDITPICTHFKSISAYTTRVANSLTMTVNGPNNRIYTGCVYFYADRSQYATANDFKAWLASEYANGTPVIVLYPLATETTEQTTAHSLHSYNGTTIVDAQTNVEPVELSVDYARHESGGS